MPYSGPNDRSLPDNVKRMPISDRQRWVAIVNSCMRQGGDDGECIRKANGVLAERRMNYSKSFQDVELFKVGKWTDSGGHTNDWTIEDLAAIATAYNETKADVHPPIKLGHDDKQRFLGDEPAAGWVENIRQVGSKLIGDFIKVPDAIATLIENGSYRSRSVELSPDFEVGGKTYKWLLTGVALLGGRLPAVNGLADILKLYEADEKSNVFLFEGDDFEAELQNIFDRLESVIKHRQGAPHVRALQAALRNAIKAHTQRSNSFDMDTEKLTKALGLSDDATEEQILEAISSRNTPPPPPPPNTDNTELSKAQERILVLEQRVATDEASRIVDEAIRANRIPPVARDTALKMALRSKDEFNAFVAAMPAVVEFGERGHSGGGSDAASFTKFEPTEAEIVVAKQLGKYGPDWRVKLMRSKADAVGITLPADFK